MQFTSGQLDYFVEESDRLGGPGAPACQQFWAEFTYAPTFLVNQDLDPFGESYTAEQIKLYEELAGHTYDITRDEQTGFDIERHIQAPNPYDHPDPAALAVHLQRLSRALRYARPQRGEELLDMGCGWGLSSELAAYLGLSVTAVDINPDFVRLVNDRATKGGLTISAVNSTFEEFRSHKSVDIVLFYECLHHAVRPWVVIDRLVSALSDGGRIVMAGEPINDLWWKSWGMRLDPISVYCIRKYGWFESGWSLSFIRHLLHNAGLIVTTYSDTDPEIGFAIVAKKQSTHLLSGRDCADLFQADGCFTDGDFLIFSGLGRITLRFPNATTTAVLNFVNFRHRTVRLVMVSNGVSLFNGDLPQGESSLSVSQESNKTELSLDVEKWIPADELGSGDTRTLGLHLRSIAFQ